MEIEGRGKFIWKRSVQPPRWTSNEAGERCVEITSKAPGMPFSRYEPLRDETGLWLQFCEIGQAPNARKREELILAFAQSYGSLGLTLHPYVSSERLADWRGEAEYLARATSLWRAAFLDHDLAATRSLLQKHHSSCRINWQDAEAWRDSDTQRDSATLEMAGAAVAGDVNGAFSRHGVSIGVAYDHVDQFPRMDFVIPNLAGCLWLQFARAIEGNKVYHQCAACKKFFEVGSNLTGRSDKRFCTPTCKANAHRRLKQEVAQLHAAGVSIREIARRTGRDIPKIKGWIKS